MNFGYFAVTQNDNAPLVRNGLPRFCYAKSRNDELSKIQHLFKNHIVNSHTQIPRPKKSPKFTKPKKPQKFLNRIIIFSLTIRYPFAKICQIQSKFPQNSPKFKPKFTPNSSQNSNQISTPTKPKNSTPKNKSNSECSEGDYG